MSTYGRPAEWAAMVGPRNWQDPPFNRWAYWHVRQFLPSQSVRRTTGLVRDLPSANPVDVGAVAVTRVDGSTGTVAAVLDDTYTDAYVVLQDGALIAEWYGPEGAPERTHALMSITKSVVGCVAAALVERGVLDPGRQVVDYVPELSGSGYVAATVRHVLDMRSGVAFSEDYADPQADIAQMGNWLGWEPGTPVDRGIYAYLSQLSAADEHGGPFRYRSVETDVLGWVCERAGGQAMSELMTELIWQPMGAEHDADLLCDFLGTALHDGGLCATARDTARFGQLLLDGGAVPDPGTGESVTVIDPQWLRRSWTVDADGRSAFAASPSEQSMPGGWYRNQFWFRPGEHGDVLLCLGIHGQMVHVSRRTRTVCVKFSTWPEAQNPRFMQDTLRAFDAIGGELTGRSHTGDRHRMRGAVAGLSRTGVHSKDQHLQRPIDGGGKS
ncbi:MAG TPA: serine hydrolase [Aldersonia sp.]